VGQLGLSEARNRVLTELPRLGVENEDIVGFADDDCWYPSDFAKHLRRCFRTRPTLDIVCGAYGPSREQIDRSRFPAHSERLLFPQVFSHPSSITMFMRYAVIRDVAKFLPCVGSGTVIPSGEDVLFLLRALRLGYSAWYDSDLTVYHEYKAENRETYALSGVRVLLGAGISDRKLAIFALRRWVRTIGRMLAHRDVRALRSTTGDIARNGLAWQIRDYLRAPSGGPL
jgi:hypothetical protein